MGQICSTNGEKMCSEYWSTIILKSGHLEDLKGDGRIIRWILDIREVGYKEGRWKKLAHYRFQWRATALAVFNVRVQMTVRYLATHKCLTLLATES